MAGAMDSPGDAGAVDSAEAQSWRAATSAGDDDALRRHLARFPGGATAPHARLRLGNRAFARIDPTEGPAALQRFVVAYPDHPKAEAARAQLSRAAEAAEAAAAARAAAERPVINRAPLLTKMALAASAVAQFCAVCLAAPIFFQVFRMMFV